MLLAGGPVTLFVVGGPCVLFCVFSMAVLKLQQANARHTHEMIEAILERGEQQERRYQERMRVMFESLMSAVQRPGGPSGG